MTLLAPGARRRSKGEPERYWQPSRRPPEPQPRQSLKQPTGPQIGASLAPPVGRPLEVSQGRVALSGTARLGVFLLLIVGLLLQRTLLPLLPWGPADLVTVLVASVALYAGPATGCLAGFGVGLLADVLSDHALGRLAAVLCVVGYACGLVLGSNERRLRWAWPTIAVAGALTPLLFGLTGAFVGDTRAGGALLLTRCVAGFCYALLLAPIVYALTHRLLAPRRRSTAHPRGAGRRPRSSKR